MVDKIRMLQDIFHESRTNLILGAKGSGKTNFVSVLMKDLVDIGYKCYTNIHFFKLEEVPRAIQRGKLPKGVFYRKVPSEIKTVSSLSALLYELLKPGMKAVFIDEGGIVSPTGSSSDTRQMKQLAYIIRHFDCAFTIITQVAGSVPPDLRQNLVDYRLSISKETKQNRSLNIGARSIATDVEGNEYIDFPTVEVLDGIPMSVYPYDGDFPSTFKIDLDLKQALDEFGNLGSSLELEDRGKDMLTEIIETKKAVPKKETIVAHLLRTTDFSFKEIAKTARCSTAYVTMVNKKLNIKETNYG